MRGSACGTRYNDCRLESWRKDSCKTQVSAKTAPQPLPCRQLRLHSARLRIRLIAPVLRELFHSVVICKRVAVNAAQQRDGNLKNRNKKVIRRFTNRPVTHNPSIATISRALMPFLRLSELERR